MLPKKPIDGIYQLHKTKRVKRASSPNRGYKWFKYPSAISKRSDCVCVYKDTRTILITQSPHLHSSIPPIHSKACTLNSSPICGEACKLIPPPRETKPHTVNRPLSYKRQQKDRRRFSRDPAHDAQLPSPFACLCFPSKKYTPSTSMARMQGKGRGRVSFTPL